MKSICLYFQIHQPLRLRRYRFFDIGNDHYYYDDFTNESIISKMAKECYLPANEILLDLIRSNKQSFKVSFSITGVTLDQFESYAPEVIESFKQLAETGCVEFLAETYSHSLAALKDQDEFKVQVKSHSQRIQELFGHKPKVFRNTELIYSDDIGAAVASLGYKGMITEGAKHILGWKSPNYLYCNALNPKLKLLMRNYTLSDDIAFRFSVQSWNEWPLTTEKFVNWLDHLDEKEEIVNVFMDYETFGEHQKKESGIFEFLSNLPAAILKSGSYKFITPSDAIKEYQPIAVAHVPHAISWADEERDLSAWLGNSLQNEAFTKLYELKKDVESLNHERINKDWSYLQCSDHFYFMCTKFFSDGDMHSYFNPYNSPYDAFINYMNVLSDFKIRLDELREDGKPATSIENELLKKDKLIKRYETEIKKLKKKILSD
ncbi:glycoside hydrolase family 57 protein [Carboxylicivirga sediminis]|uniref:Glycoside hydrolase family 57 protein n=1 Tax=Carboxylicivirga sediminis TaxID=2006564 RepID=A0A941F1H4_9BACT|nr:glycoside hydrolase family 57 protein [Carboxylicivirga sediminis]MBR8534654.1 glycoside hydrolase family 57 protein [Carboxylicivirga sediminis]